MDSETSNKRSPIKEWAKDDRPREKLIKHGATCLSNAELITILLGKGGKEEGAFDLSKRILATQDNKLQNLAKLSLDDLMKFKGIGEAKAAVLSAAFELGKRRGMSTEQRIIIKGSKDVDAYIGAELRDLRQEEFWVILLSRSNSVIERRRVSVGGVSEAFVDAKVIYKLALDKLASSIILVHNHPSGSMKPSSNDISITKSIKSGCDLLGISLLDHIIITSSEYFSFADDNTIDF
ncbi:MAG: RadC family protein [Bacteroidales bacterium]